MTRVCINAAGPVIQKSSNTEIKNLTRLADGISWSQLDGSLPLPIAPGHGTLELAEEAGTDLASLNRQMLQVVRLNAGRYELTIDDVAIGLFTHEALSIGVNLAGCQTPMWRQHLRPVSWISEGRRDLQTIRRSILSASSSDPDLESTAENLLRLAQRSKDNERERVRPRQRFYRLIGPS